MRLSVIVPVYNEEKTVAQVLTLLSKIQLDLEVIIVDDASTDHTWDILQKLQQTVPFNTYRYIHHHYNQGKGAGLRTGFRMASGDLITVQDADLEYNPLELPALLKKWEELEDPRTAIYGRRNLARQKCATRWGNRFLTWITNILFGSHISDMETWYKLLPATIARALPMQGKRFEIEPEITSCLLQAGYTIHEVPISYHPRTDKKLNPWKDGWPALAMLFKCRFGRPFHVDMYVVETVVQEKELTAVRS